VMRNKLNAQNTESRTVGDLRRRFLAKRDPSEWEFAGIREWQAELSISQLFRTSIRLQTAFDRCFSKFGVTAQEAAVLVHCAEQGETSAGKLAKAIGRDKGKITRFVDRLETSGFLKRRSAPHDRRLFIIKATAKGRRVAPQLKARFDEIRSQFFQGIENVDMNQFETVLSRLHENAERLGEKKASRRPVPPARSLNS
jgi:DNA-binding MarR family transcriptional regulator